MESSAPVARLAPALQIGSALGVAIATTVAVSRSHDFIAAHAGTNPLVVLTEGYQSAFVACAALAGIGLALTLLLPGRPRQEQLAPATGAGDRGAARIPITHRVASPSSPTSASGTRRE